MRTALAEVHVLMQALTPPPVLTMELIETVPEQVEQVKSQVRTGTEGRIVSTVCTASAQSRESRKLGQRRTALPCARPHAGSPLPARLDPIYEFPPEALPN